MSHFTVLVPAASEADLKWRLLPFHEFECTGIEACIQAIDITDEVAQLAESRGLDEALEYYGLRAAAVRPVAFDDTSPHKYGYAVVTPAGELVEAARRTNPNAKWDGWAIGGRWTGKLILKRPFGTPDSGSGKPGLLTEPNHDPGRADWAPAGEVDWQAIRDEAIGRSWARWEKFQAAYDAVSQADVDTFAGRAHNMYFDEDEGYRRECRRVFDSEDQVARFLAADYASQTFAHTLIEMKRLLLPRESYKLYAERVEALTYAFIDGDGVWNQRGEMGWFGLDDESRGTQDYDTLWWQLVENLPPQTIVYVVDCHI